MNCQAQPLTDSETNPLTPRWSARVKVDVSSSNISARAALPNCLAAVASMGRIGKALASALASLMLISCAGVTSAHSQDRLSILKAVAEDIENLKADFPQLRDFSAIKNLHAEPPAISYMFRTHEPARTGGWTSGVPDPDADGIWFHIDLHDPDSKLELHTQPVTASLCLKESRVAFLILEGRDTRSLYGPIWSVLKKHGARECGRGQGDFPRG
jgi:hypothetical protein